MKVLFCFIISILLYSSCSKEIGCENTYGNGQQMGEFLLNNNNKPWFIKNLTDSMFFVNSNGLESYFAPYYFKLNDYSKTNLQIRKKTEPCQREEYDNCIDYFDEIRYHSEFAGLNFFIIRGINFPINYPDTFNHSELVLASNEVIKIYIPGGNSYKLNINNDTILKQVSGVKLINKTLNNVYVLHNENTTNLLFIDKIYYLKEIGIVGFIMNNGEIWERNY
jgi:hypothetical protein